MSVRAGGIDWVERWREMQAAADAPGSGEAAADDPWQHRAARFDRVCRPSADVGLAQLLERVRPTDVVADIGAGTGRHAVPLASHSASIIAVEPSPAMRARLEARLAEEPVSVSVVPETWPCALPAVDVVYSCHVLYGVRDGVEFVEAMTRAARRTCILLLGLEAPTERIAPLWRSVHGFDKAPRPAALEALALLHQLGHPASLWVVPGSEKATTFLPTDDDLDELCRRLRLGANEHDRSRVQRALDALYPRSSPEAPWDLGSGGTYAIIEWPGRAVD